MMRGHASLPYKAMWPVDFGRNKEWRSIYLSRRWDRNGGARTQAADRILCRRFETLTSLFRSGQLVVVGLDREGRRQTLPRAIWMRKQTYLDPYNGDLVEAADSSSNDLFSPPLFKALMLARSEPSHQGFQSDRTAKTKPRNKPKNKQGERAPGRVARALPAILAKHNITEKGDRSWVEIANVIGSDMPNPPKSENDINALATAIRRHFTNLKKRRKR